MFTINPELKRRLYKFIGLSPDGSALPDPKSAMDGTGMNVLLVRLMEYHALYGSDMGNSRVRQPSGDLIPTKYFFVQSGQDDNNIGAAVHRAHTLIELRTAMLFDRGTIAEVGQALIAQGDEMAKQLLRATSHGIGKRAMVSAFYRHTLLASFCHGGLTYRISQSERYHTELMGLASSVQRATVGGRPNFLDVLRSNHQTILNSTKSVGDRYSQLGTRIDKLISAYYIERQKNLTIAAGLIATCILSLSCLNYFKENGLWGYNIVQIAVALVVLTLAGVFLTIESRAASWFVRNTMIPPELREFFIAERRVRRIKRLKGIVYPRRWRLPTRVYPKDIDK